jgi:hypothetical protein
MAYNRNQNYNQNHRAGSSGGGSGSSGSSGAGSSGASYGYRNNTNKPRTQDYQPNRKYQHYQQYTQNPQNPQKPHNSSHRQEHDLNIRDTQEAPEPRMAPEPRAPRPPMEETRAGISIAGNILAKISFCDKQCSNINDNKVKAQIVKHLEAQYDIPIISRDFNVINPNNLRIVSFHQHVLTPLTNGNPYLLFLIRIDGINCCIYIDRKLKDGYTYPKMHCVKYNFHDELFEKETVFSGELVKDTERRWFFLIDGILLYKGLPTTDKNIIARYELIHSIMESEYTRDMFLEICPLQIKRLFLYRDVEKMVYDFIPNLSYTCKGILFYTLNSRCSNFAFLLPRDAQFEIKTTAEIDDIVQAKYPKLWAKKHDITQEQIPDALSNNTNSTVDDTTLSSDTIDIAADNVVFKILKTDIPDIYNLYCMESETGNLVKYGIALVPNIRISHYLYNGFKGNANSLDMRVECRFSKIFEKWSPVRFVSNDVYNKDKIEKMEDAQKAI